MGNYRSLEQLSECFLGSPADPEAVALYLASLAATHRPATHHSPPDLDHQSASANGLASPASVSQLVVGETLKGIRRTLGTAQPEKAPLITLDIPKLLAHLPRGLTGVRDRRCSWSAHHN